MKIIVIGDIHVDVDFFAEQTRELEWAKTAEIRKLYWDIQTKEEFQRVVRLVEKNGPTAIEYPPMLDEEIIDADVVFTHCCPIPSNLIRKANQLKLIGTCRGGLEHIDIEEAGRRNISVINAIRNAEPVADFTIGLIYSETRNIARSHQQIIKGKWPKSFPNSSYTSDLNKKIIGIMGFGNIGKLVAEKLIGLGIETLVYDAYMTKEQIVMEMPSVTPVTLEELYEQSDVITIHLRFEKGNPPLIDKAAFEKMKPGCTLINTSRAYVIDEKALLKALKTKQIAGAALDVFSEEPLPTDHPLLDLENVTLTSHIGGDTIAAIPMSPKILIKNVREKYSTI